jgi:hypothetical protein
LQIGKRIVRMNDAVISWSCLSIAYVKARRLTGRTVT